MGINIDLLIDNFINKYEDGLRSIHIEFYLTKLMSELKTNVDVKEKELEYIIKYINNKIKPKFKYESLSYYFDIYLSQIAVLAFVKSKPIQIKEAEFELPELESQPVVFDEDFDALIGYSNE